MKVSIQQAAANALAEFIRPKFPDCQVASRWVVGDKGFPGPNGKAITVVTAGDLEETTFQEAQLLSVSTPVNGRLDASYQSKVGKQSYQIDVWATSFPERDDILARLQEDVFTVGEAGLTGVFNPDPVSCGLLLYVSDGWQDFGTTADFEFYGPHLMDTADTVGRTTYRALIECNGYFGIAQKKTNLPAKKPTNIALTIAESGNPNSHSDTK